MSDTIPLGPSNDRIPAGEWRLAHAEARAGLATQVANAAFAALPPAEKRVAIAKDVLKWMAIAKLTPQAGSYLGVSDPGEGDQMAGVIAVDTPTVNGYTCTACAIGGLFACAVERGEAGGTIQAGFGRSEQNTAGKYMRERLGAFFERDQLLAIELAFEGDSTWMEPEDRDRLKKEWGADQFRAVLYSAGGWSVPAAGRMTAVMQNIIDHGGEFVVAA